MVLGTPARELPEPASEVTHGSAAAMPWPELSLLPYVDLNFCLQGARGEQGEKGSMGFPGARGPGGQKVRSWAAPTARVGGGVLGAPSPSPALTDAFAFPRGRWERQESLASR